jgi:hypothetical protein
MAILSTREGVRRGRAVAGPIKAPLSEGRSTHRVVADRRDRSPGPRRRSRTAVRWLLSLLLKIAVLFITSLLQCRACE